MSHNVPVVYEVLDAQIRKCAAFPGRTKFGVVSRGKEQATDLGATKPEGATRPNRKQTCYAKFLGTLSNTIIFTKLFTIFLCYIFNPFISK
jgi:hypothetical protein